MDKITGFSDDELLVKILSFLPTKFAITTSVLSKRWKFLWMRVPKLEYEMSMYSSEFYHRYLFPEEGDSETYSIELERCERMRCFIDKNLPLHSSPVIKSLKLTFYNELFQPEAIKLWVEIAISRCVEELSVAFSSLKGKLNVVMPSSLYTCKSLVTLKLTNGIYVDVPHVFCLPSLKTLHLRHVIYADEESLQRLLSNSSVLEDLVMQLYPYDNVRKFAVIIPSLLSLSFRISESDMGASKEFRIDTPSLKYFTVFCKSSFGLIESMPKLEEANITASHNIKKLLELVTSVKRLSLTIMHDNAEALTAVYAKDIVFKELEHLKFRIHHAYWSKVLHWLLIASPKLRKLEFDEHFSRDGMDTLVCWKQLNSVPQCLLSSLQTFKWTCYQISVECKDLVKYILRKSCQLKTAKIVFGRGLDPQKKFETETEVKFCFRASPIVILSTAEESCESRLLTALKFLY
ncbi:PREDICTED: putative F-box/FBD/LRR-repeat protein At5g62970 [Camelina sativa]|uniref:F-box/FBD/LRR-repeat protein At5g62970 n=1 Tax=Camelina sativa TaxID=90675 RepID=A0ABM1QJQ8_CAMSA|nr:PREDICTED: putative F-box/FBD/LRR-repeat protein At5g62970 [Camelina sativa]